MEKNRFRPLIDRTCRANKFSRPTKRQPSKRAQKARAKSPFRLGHKLRYRKVGNWVIPYQFGLLFGIAPIGMVDPPRKEA